jgi:hypothetical protein
MHKTPSAPPVYRPQPSGQTGSVQPHMQTTPSAPAAFRPFPPGIRQTSFPVIQRGKDKKNSSVSKEVLTDAQHNWIEVIAKYGTSRSDIEKYAVHAGYDVNTAGDAIIRAIGTTKWADKKIAHSLGESGSAVRAGTMEKIESCKQLIKDWLDENHGPNYREPRKKKK